ncbi:hypothetical protein [Pseudodesulfovibrio indicus]|nr:hypothetical protein [Pseudodesulfovibrio indicus]
MFSDLWDGIKTIGSAVKKVVKKVYEIISDERTVIVYDRLKRVMDDCSGDPNSDACAPDFVNLPSVDMESRLSEHDERIEKNAKSIRESYQLLAVQSEINRMRLSAEIIDSSMRNVKIHASSLSTHYQNMRNINGLVNDGNAMRYALKKLMSVVNYNANLIANGGNNPMKIEGVDIDKKDGAVSIVAAFDAFDRTRELLTDEVVSLCNLSEAHLQDIKKLKRDVSGLKGEIKHKTIQFLENMVEPKFKDVHRAARELQSEVAQLPAGVREPDGKFVFENNQIKMYVPGDNS